MNYREEWEWRAGQDGSYAIALALIDVAYALRALGSGDAGAHLCEKIQGLNNSLIEATELICNAIGRGAEE